MTVPAIGEPDPVRAEPSRTGFGNAAGGILVLLALGLAVRLIIAYLLPGSGFKVDLASFQFWASNLAQNGLSGFYDRDFFHDYTPGYLYVLWLIGGLGNLVGGIGDLIKIPPILADLALGYLVWSMVKELGGSERSARIGAAIVILNPVSWFDSVVWGQVDSVGVVVLLLALRELWRDRPERAAILATLAALIKPQLGILIPLIAIVVIRRAFWPDGAYGAEGEPEPRSTTTAWERRVRGPIRVVTTGVAGFLTAIVVSLPFGLSLPGLVAQVFKTAAGYPYLSVNAFNPWALVSQTTADGTEQSIALTRTWVCDATITPSAAGGFRIGDWVVWSWPASTTSCPDGVMIGAFPAVLVGSALFVIAAAIVVWLVARRPDRLTMLVALAVLALAFFDLPTRVHERYLFPLVAIGAILAAVSVRWRIAYVLSAAATLANMYVVLTTYYPDNPQISDWLGIGPTLSSYWGIAIAATIQVAILVWAFFQLREEAVEGLAENVEESWHDRYEAEHEAPWLGRRVVTGDDTDAGDQVAPGAPGAGPPASRTIPAWAAGLARSSATDGPANDNLVAGDDVAVLPAWEMTRDAGSLGPWAWFRARLNDSPVRADLSRSLENERGGRVDKLDLWVLVFLTITLFTVRMWRLDEPYQMHFDEVYHARTAMEFLQDWKYGISHDIYEWTHPHLAKYAMAVGIVALGEDKVSSTSQLGAPVVDAAVEPRRDDGLTETQVEGDRLWVATGTEVRAYDLATRELAGTLSLPGAVALAYDPVGRVLYVGTRSGEIRIVDTGGLDATRRAPPGEIDSRAFMNVDGPIEQLFLTRDGNRLAAVLTPGFGSTDPALSSVVVMDTGAATELGRPAFDGVTQLTEGNSDDRIAVGTSSGIAFIDTVDASVDETFDVGGPVEGLVGINNIQDDPIYASVLTPDGPRIAVVVAKTGDAPRTSLSQTLTLPGATAGRAYYDAATRMVHVEGSQQASTGLTGAAAETMYVIDPHGVTVFADAPLGFVPSVMVLDQNEQYPSTDREQLLAFDAGGDVAAIEIGRTAYAWRVPGVIAGVLMAIFLYILARLLFRRRSIAILLGLVVLADGMLFAQSRIGMNDSYVGLGIVAAYTIFAWLWLHPGNSRRHWVAFAVGVPLMGLFLGFGLASKWVAAYAIGGLGLLVLARSALGRLLLILSMLVLTTALGYVAISVPAGQDGGNYVFLAIMVGLLITAVLVNVVHPIAWTFEELRFAVGAPIAAGMLAILYGLGKGDAAAPFTIGPLSVTAIQLGLLGFLAAAVTYVLFAIAGRFGFGPLAPAPDPDDPAAVLEPAAEAPVGWLRLGSGFGLPAIWLFVGLLVIPVGLYILSYVPWAFVENHQLFGGWPPGHTGQTLWDLTFGPNGMYAYHNNLASAHPASSPWWAWTLDLKPVWFYEGGFAGGTSASIYDAGNFVAWWFGVPAMAFIVWQAFRRRSAALALIAIGFAAQWISWARIDRAAFQYHYYTSLPFVFLALAYFLAELWQGTSRRIWLYARLSGAAIVLLPFALWLLDRPLCAIVRVTDIVPNSQACPALIPDVTIAPRAIAIAVIIGIGVLLLLRELLSVDEDDEPSELDDERRAGGWRAALARVGLGGRWASAALIAVITTVAFLVAQWLIPDSEGFELSNIPVEPIAAIVLLALTPVAAYVATARDSRRFVMGAVAAMGFWFVLWYPNISALPLPAALHNAYQGFLPTYLYPFQFWVLQGTRAAAPPLLAAGPAVMLVSLTFMAIVIGYSAWSWRVALAERRRDALAADDAGD